MQVGYMSCKVTVREGGEECVTHSIFGKTLSPLPADGTLVSI